MERKLRRVTAEEVAKRLERVETLMASCTPTLQIERQLRDDWKISRRQVRVYMQRVKERWATEASKVGREERRMELRELIRAAIAKAERQGDVMRGLDQLAKLDGLYEPDRVETKHEVSGGPALVVTVEDARKLAREGSGG